MPPATGGNVAAKLAHSARIASIPFGTNCASRMVFPKVKYRFGGGNPDWMIVPDLLGPAATGEQTHPFGLDNC